MFKRAVPVYKAGCETEMNLFLGFFAEIPKKSHSLLRIAGSSLYAIFVNGKFVFSGPARAAHGIYRVDELPLDAYLDRDHNILTIQLAAYNCNSFSFIDVPGFLCAEVENDTGVISWTDAAQTGGFGCVLLDEKLQRVFRYSFQRNFTEAYRLDSRYMQFHSDPAHSGHEAVTLEAVGPKHFIPRNLFYPLFEIEKPESRFGSGIIEDAGAFTPHRSREHFRSDTFKCFSEEELEFKCIDAIQSMKFVKNDDSLSGDPENIKLTAGHFADLTFANELTGFLEFDLHADEDTDLFLTFDEVYNGQLDFLRLGCANCVTFFTAAGDYHCLTMEPYSLKYLRLICRRGSVEIRNLQLRRVGFPAIDKTLHTDDAALQKIYRAAVESFRQNTYDIYMDCPSRERAGWLCDSFFTSRVEYALTGRSDVEREFLTNFIDCTHCPDIPDAMLPMCYPSDHTDHCYIPNWAMWYVLELEEYLDRTGDTVLIARAEKRVLDLLAFLRTFENSDGLLEKLASWVFVEWSHSNDLVQDVNYPSNMLYARMKRAIARLYHKPELIAEAENIEAYIRNNTMVNGFFCDNSYRRENGLELSGECTESCQYYAFFMNIATPESHPALWHTLLHDFGPQRREHNLHPDIAFANSFVGNYLRLDLLSRYGFHDKLLEEIKGYFLYMAEKTGTLWENTGDYASCNHGFASHVAVWLNKIIN